jgi:hypothetical protein
MFASVIGSAASLAFPNDLEFQTTFLTMINFAFLHFGAVDHASLLIDILALDYIQQESLIKCHPTSPLF